MKTVFTNDMCAHIWAAQSQEHGRSSSMKFTGTVIYSYATAMAQIYKRENLALVNCRTYSKTTSCKHMPAITRALSIPFVRVPHVQPVGSGNHAENLTYLVAQYEAEKLRLKRARYIGDYSHLQTLAGNVRLYALAFKLKTPKLDAAKDEREIRAFRDERDARLNTAPAQARRVAAAARRGAAAAAAVRKREALMAAGISESVARFRAGEPAVRIYGQQNALLRIANSGKAVETSHGASVPIEEARAACAFVLARCQPGTHWSADNHAPMSIGPFSLRSIDPTSGIVRVGCHFIEISEVAALAAQIGAPA